MNGSNSSIVKIENAAKSSKYECLDCENYKRKVTEAEQSVSGRDVLIEMLQGEIRKMEDRYKISIDDYELLRFKYCTVVQELGNFKEIHKKLEKSNQTLTKERDNAINQLALLQKEMNSCRNQCKELLPNVGGIETNAGIRGDSLHKNILKEVMNIEVIIQNQNETVNDVLKRVLKEMGGSKQYEVIQSNVGENIKEKNKEDLLMVIDDLNDQISRQNTFVEKLKAENETIKTQLTEKKTNLVQCLGVLEDNHSNLNNLSGSIEMIIKEKETYLKEIGHLKDVIGKRDMEIQELKNVSDSARPDSDLKRENEELRKALNDRGEELEQLQDQLKNVKVCVPEECQKVAKVITENKAQGNEVKAYTSGLQTNLDSMKENEDLSKALTDCQKELAQLQENHLKNLNLEDKKENYEITDEDVIGSNKYKNDVAELNNKIEILEKNLEQTKLQNSQYEEEYHDCTTKINNLEMQVIMLEDKNMKMENKVNDVPSIAELQEKYENLSSQKELEIKALKDEINNLKKTDQENVLKDQIEQMEKQLSDTEKKKTLLIQENDSYKNQLTQLQNEIVQMQEEGEKQILKLQEKIDMLEHSEQIKQEEIDQCCCVVKSIQEAMEKNNSAEIKDLENQYMALQEENKAIKTELERLQTLYKDCECAANKQTEKMNNMGSEIEKLGGEVKELEIELCKRECLNEKLQNNIGELEVEICRRQCTITHLEQCLDKSNEILSECEKEMKDMHSENEELKKENESLQEHIRSYASEVQRSSDQQENLQEKLANYTRQSQQLESQNQQLINNLQEKTGVEDDLKQTQEKYNHLVKATQEKDNELRDAKKLIDDLQSTLEKVKTEQSQIKQAYKEAQATLSEEIKKFNEQTEKMNNESYTVEARSDENETSLAVKECMEKLAEKEKIIQALEGKNQEFMAHVAQHKGYVSKLISDNNTLRKAVDKMLATLGQKLKNFTSNEDSISPHSNESIMKDILESLIDLEKSVTDTSSSPEKCNCMSVIKSTYKAEGKDQNLPPCKIKCGKRGKDMSQYIECAKTCRSALGKFCEKCCTEKQENVKTETSKDEDKICDDCENLPSTSKS